MSTYLKLNIEKRGSVMSKEFIVTAIGLTCTAIGLMFKVVSDMKHEVEVTTAFRVREEEQDKLVDHRLTEVEKDVKDLDYELEDIKGYLSSNSDWQVRRNHH